MRRLTLLALLLAASACAAGRPRLGGAQIIGKPMDLGVTALDGAPVAVGGADGSVRLVVLWASWCHPCQSIFPALAVIAEGYATRGLRVVAISVDEDVELLREAAEQVPRHLRVAWDRGAERLGERLGVERLPTFVLLDRRGIARHVHQGTDDRILEQIDREVRRLLAD